MSRLIIAIIITIILISGLIILEIVTDKTIDELTQRIDDLMINTPDAEYDPDDIEELISWWSKKHDLLEIFVPHTFLNEMDIVLGELLGAVEAEDYPTSTALLNRLYRTSIAMKGMFSLRIGNIL